VRALSRLCELYLAICLTTEEKARKNLGEMSRHGAANSPLPQFAHNFSNGLKIYIRVAKILYFLLAELLSDQNTYTRSALAVKTVAFSRWKSAILILIAVFSGNIYYTVITVSFLTPPIYYELQNAPIADEYNVHKMNIYIHLICEVPATPQSIL